LAQFKEDPMSSRQSVPPTPENAHIYADFMVQQAAEVSGVHLDYSPDSLTQVDKIVKGFRQERHTSKSVDATLLSFGCYVGKVSVRNAGGTWKNTDETTVKKPTLGAAGSPIVVEGCVSVPKKVMHPLASYL
jgi:hypothetical protein